MKSLVDNLSLWKRKRNEGRKKKESVQCWLSEISYFFLWESQNKGQWILLHSFSLSHFAASHRAHNWGCPLVKCCTVDHLLHFRRGSCFSFFPLFCGLSSSVLPSLNESCCPWLFNISDVPSAVTSSNPALYASLLMSAVFSSGPNHVKSCKFWEKFVPHIIQTVHCHFILSCVDVINALPNVEWVPVVLDSFVWPVQNCHHFCESLAEVMGLKAYYYPLVHWLQKWSFFYGI